jgi:hypothetical protein
MDVPTEVFLSHSSQDGAFARLLVEMVKDHGVPVWYSPIHIIGAQQWHDEIGNALNRCDWFIVILSPDSVDSMWVKRETLYALQQQRYEGRTIPILYRDCDTSRLSWVLSSFQFVDFRGDVVSASRKLLRVWGMTYHEP